MSNKLYIRKLVIFFVIMFIVKMSIFSNPFTGNENSPTPVYKKPPSQTMMQAQKKLNSKLGDYIAEWKEEKNPIVLLSILGISFLYGIVHAAGPGHRKTVVFSFYLTRHAKAIEPLITGIQLGFLHGFSAIVLMLIFKGIKGAISATSNNTLIYIEGFGFVILIVFAIYGIIEALMDALKPESHAEKHAKKGAILLSGIHPCPAAMLVLVLAISLDIVTLGIFAMLSMSIGMSLPVIIAGYLAWAGRSGIFTKLKFQGNRILIVSTIIQVLGYGFLLFISLQTALPFIIGLFKKCFF